MNKLRKLLENREKKKKSNEVFTTIETSEEYFTKKLLEKRDKTYKISIKLKKAIHLGNKIKILYKKIKMKLQE